MPRRLVVAARVLVGRVVAAADLAALRAAAQMDPAAAHLQALRAAGDALAPLGVFDRVQVRTGGGHPPTVPRQAGRATRASSTREREIAELVGQGRSNKEVAATLFLSEKTIENTLSRVYGKLGLRSRVELARVALPA